MTNFISCSLCFWQCRPWRSSWRRWFRWSMLCVQMCREPRTSTTNSSTGKYQWVTDVNVNSSVSLLVWFYLIFCLISVQWKSISSAYHTGSWKNRYVFENCVEISPEVYMGHVVAKYDSGTFKFFLQVADDINVAMERVCGTLEQESSRLTQTMGETIFELFMSLKILKGFREFLPLKFVALMTIP